MNCLGSVKKKRQPPVSYTKRLKQEAHLGISYEGLGLACTYAGVCIALTIAQLHKTVKNRF
jgi:hypothetical protein